MTDLSRLAAGLNHPHTLPLYDSGATAGHLYYVMPYVEGERLGNRPAGARTVERGTERRKLVEIAGPQRLLQRPNVGQGHND